MTGGFIATTRKTTYLETGNVLRAVVTDDSARR